MGVKSSGASRVYAATAAGLTRAQPRETKSAPPLALQAWGVAYRNARGETITYPKTTTLLCYVGDATYRVLAYDRACDSSIGVRPSLPAYVARLEATPDEWPGWGKRREGQSDIASRGLYELQLMELAALASAHR